MLLCPSNTERSNNSPTHDHIMMPTSSLLCPRNAQPSSQQLFYTRLYPECLALRSCAQATRSPELSHAQSNRTPNIPPAHTPQPPPMSALSPLSASAAASITTLLESQSAGTFPYSEQAAFVTVASTDAIQTAFKVLLDAKIQSAPVYDKATGSWLGFVDLGDFAKYVSECRGRGLCCGAVNGRDE